MQSPNVLLARDYTAKLADVGLAKLMLRDCLSTLRDVRPPLPCAALLMMQPARRRPSQLLTLGVWRGAGGHICMGGSRGAVGSEVYRDG